MQTEDQIPPEYRPTASRPYLPGAGQGDAETRRENQRKLEGESRIIQRQQDDAARRVEQHRRQRDADERMTQALRSCEMYKYSPELMNPEQSSLCYRAWGDKANRTLGR